MSRFPAPHTLAAFSIRPRIHFGRLPRLDCHITDCFHQHHYIVPHPSQRRLTAPTVQFSAGIVILCGVRREPPTSAGRDPATGGTDQARTGGLLIPNQARYQLRYGSILAADGGVDPHGFHRALFSRQAPRPLEIICRIVPSFMIPPCFRTTIPSCAACPFTRRLDAVCITGISYEKCCLPVMFAGCFLLVRVATPLPFFPYTPQISAADAREGRHGTFQPCAGVSVASVFQTKPEPAN